jgi:hypothetical protein
VRHFIQMGKLRRIHINTAFEIGWTVPHIYYFSNNLASVANRLSISKLC